VVEAGNGGPPVSVTVLYGGGPAFGPVQVAGRLLAATPTETGRVGRGGHVASDEIEQAVARGTLDERGERVQERREALLTARIELAEALASDTPADRWQDHVREALERTRVTLHQHVEEAEAPDGLLAQIIQEEPAFGARVQEMRDEHVTLLQEAADLAEMAGGDPPADALRARAEALVELIERHRSRSGALLVDAYSLDISAGD
jgi:hypothetical protein